MQYAKCTSDNKVWEARPFSLLESSVLESKRLSLVCVECEEFAWFRKESSHGHPAHFCARHDDNCSLKIEYVMSDDKNDGSSVEVDEVKSGDKIIIQLDKEVGGVVEVVENTKPTNSLQGEGGRTFVLKGSNREASQQFTLKRILHRLVQSPAFRESNTEISFFKNSEEILISGMVNSIVAGFEKISKESHHEKMQFYWGPIASAKYTADGKLWLNSGEQYGSASVAIFEDVTQSFLSSFEVEDLEELAGAYILVYGRCMFSGGGSGKPVIWCAHPKYIFVRKYRSQQLQA
ncbi:hypothetical protein D0C16_13795 [Cellvibrio sp. KY-GH-1]|uniref:hypothetical protein n=1 Tax=Cellvibrio sp. KY-GH-1 TaxID=2303332 RepID=UPI001247DF10|nr:hypothetical protein [Cellvibrio sp. KY-GH-1]QEY16951.1 hypothetical protein D0C16_13795 [Cellvibrio sp. KY-GH-1]